MMSGDVRQGRCVEMVVELCGPLLKTPSVEREQMTHLLTMKGVWIPARAVVERIETHAIETLRRSSKRRIRLMHLTERIERHWRPR